MREPRSRARAVLVVLCALVAVLAGCTGVPTSSPPETIQPIDLSESGSAPPKAPSPNIDPRSLVREFLDAGTLDPADHRSARRYLSPAARERWSDASATIVTTPSIGLYVPGKPIVVKARVVGTLNTRSGIYSPQLVGTEGKPRDFTFKLTRVDGEFRISSLPNGLLLSTEQFQNAYFQHSVYFYDNAHRALVPDSRWTALKDRALNTWLVGQLVIGPRAELRNAVTTDVIPEQATIRRVTASAGVPIKAEIPGASQLDPTARRRLATEVGATLAGPDSGELIMITDGGANVPIPGFGADGAFTTSELSRYVGPPVSPSPDVYYLRPGRIVRGAAATPIRGKLDPKPYSYFFTSLGVSGKAGGRRLTVAAVSGTGATARLVVGDQSGGYRLTSPMLQGPMSRPAFAPGRTEVWVGVGSKLYRAPVTGNVARPEQVSVPSAASGGRIVAVRISPEGTRIAMVIASSGGERQLFVGSILRSAGQVRVDILQSVSPNGVRVDDVAWLGYVKLIAIGQASDGEPRIFETNVDGAGWTSRATGLPDPPDSITAAVNQLAWVSTKTTVWQQDGGRGWTPAGSGSQTAGDKPVYEE